MKNQREVVHHVDDHHEHTEIELQDVKVGNGHVLKKAKSFGSGSA